MDKLQLLTPEEIRIIGALIEKEYTTPEYYPLSINSLTNACNQKSSRNPVVNYKEEFVDSVVQKLRDKQLVAKSVSSDQRVPKYKQNFTEHHQLTKPQIAVICILFLRGAQTIGEIKSRTYRIYEFADIAQTEKILDELIYLEGNPFIIKLPKESGHENRYTHLFGGEPEKSETNGKTDISKDDKITELEEKLDRLIDDFNKLSSDFEKFKNSFG